MNTLNNFISYFSPSEEKHYPNFLSEQKKLLEDPYLNVETKLLINDRIENIKKKSQEKDKQYASTQLVTTSIITVAGFFAGPVGTGVSVALTHSKKSPQKIYDIHCAKKCQGTRVVQKKRKKQCENRPHAITAGVVATVWSLISPMSYICKGVIGLGVDIYKSWN